MNKVIIPKTCFGSNQLWEALQRRLKNADISPQQVNEALKVKDKVSRFIRPDYYNVHVLLELLKLNMGDFISEEVHLRSLTLEQEEVLKSVSELSVNKQKALLGILTDLSGNIFKNIDRSPKVRLRFFLDHSDYELIPLASQYARIPKCNVEEAELAEWYIGNYKRVYSSTLSISMEEIVKIADLLNISPRWLCGYKETSSFWGYSPLAETILDQWSVSRKYAQAIATEILKNS